MSEVPELLVPFEFERYKFPSWIKSGFAFNSPGVQHYGSETMRSKVVTHRGPCFALSQVSKQNLRHVTRVSPADVRLLLLVVLAAAVAPSCGSCPQVQRVPTPLCFSAVDRTSSLENRRWGGVLYACVKVRHRNSAFLCDNPSQTILLSVCRHRRVPKTGALVHPLNQEA